MKPQISKKRGDNWIYQKKRAHNSVVLGHTARRAFYKKKNASTTSRKKGVGPAVSKTYRCAKIEEKAVP